MQLKRANVIPYFLGAILLLCINLKASVDFTSPPTVSPKDGKIQISFSVSASTDVEVAILDANNKIVRHLAAGVLGGASPPPPPLSTGLSQILVWDNNDDYGRPASGGPFKTKVSMGLTPEFERAISTNNLPGNHYPSAVPPTGNYAYLGHPFYIQIATTGVRKSDLDITVNDVTEEIYMRPGLVNYGHDTGLVYRFNGRTGEYLGLVSFGFFRQAKWGVPVVSWDGEYIYHSSGQDTIYRFKTTGSADPWPGIGTYRIGGFPQGFQHARGHATGPDGSVFALHNRKHRGIDEGLVSQIGPNGSVLKDKFIWIESQCTGGIKVDKQGNIYVGALVKPGGQQLPAELVGKLPSGSSDAESLDWMAKNTYGSILKFGPSGGKVYLQQGGDLMVGRNISNSTTGTSEGLLQIYPMGSPIISGRMAMGGCQCYVSVFDVDRFGRVFMPDCFSYRMVVYDNSGNLITRINYKDIMSQGGITVGWAHHLEVTDRALYGADYFNNKVISLVLKSEKEVMVELPVAVEEGAYLRQEFSFVRNYPNPFNPSTTIRFSFMSRADTRADQKVFVAVYDANKRLIKILVNEVQPAGTYSIQWDGKDHSGRGVGSGVYLCRLETGNQVKEKNMILIR